MTQKDFVAARFCAFLRFLRSWLLALTRQGVAKLSPHGPLSMLAA